MPGPELAPFMSVFRAGESRRVRRNRLPVSCMACQRRKSKCDRRQPCGACAKRGDDASCRFGQALGKQEVQERLTKLEEMVRGLASSFSPNNADGSRLMSPFVTGEGVDTQYHGETSWEALVENIHDIQTLLKMEEENSSRMEQPEPQDMDILLEKLSVLSVNDTVSSMPCRPDADRLVAAYFNAKFAAVPFIHVHHFRHRYEAFWKDPSSCSFLWISIMFSILSSGAMVNRFRGQHNLKTAAEPRFYLQKAAECLVTGQYLKAKPYSVEALLMYAHTRNILKTDSDPTIWSLFGLAARLAQRRGYHLDAAKVSPHITEFEAEMRRRAWFMAQASDLLFSFQLGMPTAISQDVCDAGHPRNLSDDDFDEDTPVPPSRPDTDPTPMLAWATKSRLCRILRRIIHHALKVKKPPYRETLALTEELEQYYASVPQHLRIRPIESTAFTDDGHTIMFRLMLELMYRKALCLLHRQYLTADKENTQYDLSRQICRDSALRLLDLHHEFDQQTRPGGRMYDDRYMVSSLTLHDFLVASMAVCLDLSESTDISLQERTYRIQVLRRAYDIWSERSATSQDALHASKVLRAILNKVETPPLATSTTSSSETPAFTPESTTGQSSSVGSTELMQDLAPVSSVYTTTTTTAAAAEEYPAHFDMVPSLDGVLDSKEGVDWNVMDAFLRSTDPVWTDSAWNQPMTEPFRGTWMC